MNFQYNSEINSHLDIKEVVNSVLFVKRAWLRSSIMNVLNQTGKMLTKSLFV